MLVLIVVIVGFAAFFWAITYLPGILEKQKNEETRIYLSECLRFGAHSVPRYLRDVDSQAQFKSEIVAMVIEAGLTPDEADIWISRDGVLGALMTIPAVYARRKVKDAEAHRVLIQIASEEAVSWMRMYRNGLGPNRTSL